MLPSWRGASRGLRVSCPLLLRLIQHFALARNVAAGSAAQRCSTLQLALAN